MSEPAAPAIAKPPPRRRISLALQGGGTHGAFTWGVLERLLEDDRLEVDGLSGTSAGAINGVMLVGGLLADGPAGAIAGLDRFWRSIAARLAISPLRATPLEKLMWGHDLTWSVAYRTFDTLSRVLSPYQINPFPYDYNPLRAALEDSIDFERLRMEAKAPRLFVSATSVRTGKPRVFTRRELTVEMLLASACLPQVFKAVEIDGEPYWDGGYLGNPALWPLYDQGGPPDLVLVQLNPQVREEAPTSASDILNRLTEITFNGSLMAEMRARISRMWTGLRTTSSTPDSKSLSVCSSEGCSLSAITGAELRSLMRRGQTMSLLHSPMRKARTALRSSSGAVETHSPKSLEPKPALATPSRPKSEWYPSFTSSRSSTITIIGPPSESVDLTCG